MGSKTPAPRERPSPADATRTVAHHLDSAAFNIGHSQRHIEAAKTAKGGSLELNLQHASKHAKETKATLEKLTDSVVKKMPAVKAELEKLQAAKPKGK